MIEHYRQPDDPEKHELLPIQLTDAEERQLIAFLKLVGENYVPEVEATIDLYHQWLDAEERAAGAIVDVEGKKRCHQILGQLEHVQLGQSIKRIALLDDVSHHLRFQALTDQMSNSEKETLNKVLQEVGAQSLTELRLKRDIKWQDNTWVLV